MTTTTKAWTLGNPAGYEEAVRIPGNKKAPGGYAFETASEAASYAFRHEEARGFKPYAMELPGTFEECTTEDFVAAQHARHAWHLSEDGPEKPVKFMAGCGICKPRRPEALGCRLLVVAAPFIVPNREPQ